MQTTESTAKRTRPIVLGVVIGVVAVVAAVVLWLMAVARFDAAVDGLARAPIGCDTTLDFAAPGDYLVFVESQGTFDDVRGDCGATGEYSVEVARASVDVTVLDPDGAQIDLDPREGDVAYSAGGFSGRSVLDLRIEEAGDHVMRVDGGGATQFAVAIGRDPNSGVALLKGAAVAVGLAGLILGVLLAVFGGRRRATAGAGWTPAQPGMPQWGPGQPQPAQPPYVQPGQPPVAQPPVAPPTQPASGGPPLYGGYGEPGHYGQAQPAPPAPSRVPMPPDTRPPAPPSANPFAPPAGAPLAAPTQNQPLIPGQPPGPAPSSDASGDGSIGWPMATDDGEDAPTPPRGNPVVSHDDTPPSTNR